MKITNILYTNKISGIEKNYDESGNVEGKVRFPVIEIMCV
jgi:antitoxin component YwqK of YwqJK toxin-antitoxin module